MFIILMANNSPLRNQTPPCNGNPTLILKIFQPHRDLEYWKIQQAPPGTRGGVPTMNPMIGSPGKLVTNGRTNGLSNGSESIGTTSKVGGSKKNEGSITYPLDVLLKSYDNFWI